MSKEFAAMLNAGKAISSGITQAGNYAKYAGAGQAANGVSAAAQAAQANYNSNATAIANQLGTDRLMQQYAFNSAQSQYANQWSEAMWDKTAAWNEMMWQKQADFNSQQAQIQRDWQERMSNTSYQRAIQDMEKAGLNPILAVTGGGLSGASLGGSGSAATVGNTSMSPITGQMASGGLLQGQDSSISNYTGQMEYYSLLTGLIGSVMGGLSSAFKGMGSLGDLGKGLGEGIGAIFNFDGLEMPWMDKGADIGKDLTHKHGGSSGSYKEDRMKYQWWKNYQNFKKNNT